MAVYRVKTTIAELISKGLVNSPNSPIHKAHEQSIKTPIENDCECITNDNVIDKGYVFAESTHFE